MAIKITKKSVDAMACEPGKIVFAWDTDLKGFGVACLPSGTRTFYCQTKTNGRTQRVKIGLYGRMTAEQGRAAALKQLAAIEAGADPNALKRAARGVRTFREIAESWIEEQVAAKRKPRTRVEFERILRKHVLPAIGSIRITDLTRREVTRMHRAMANTPFQANRCLALVSSIWTWASKVDEVDFAKNPARGIERNREQGRERYLSADEMQRLGDVLRESETVGLPWTVNEAKATKHLAKESNRRTKLDPFAVAAIRLLILTGMRLREVLHLEWAHVDMERGALFLPDSKTGKKTVILGAPALEILAGLPRVRGSQFVIVGKGLDKPGSGTVPATTAKPRADLAKPWAAVRRAAGLEGVRLHDLRHTFASTGAGASLSLPTIGKLLGHTQAATTQRYAHIASDPLRRAADTISSEISAAMAGKLGAMSWCFPHRQEKR